MKITQFMIGVVAVFTAILSFGVAAAQAAEEQITVQNGTLSGRVTNLQGEPLAEASISAVRTNENHLKEYYGTATDANGMYTLSLTADVYDVSISKSYDVYIPSWYLAEDEALDTVLIEEGTVTIIDIVLPRWSAISGTITFTEDIPTPTHVEIYLLEPIQSDDGIYWNRERTVHAEQMPDGTFSWRMMTVLPNTYYLCAFAPVYLGENLDEEVEISNFHQCYGGTTIDNAQAITVGVEETIPNLSIPFTSHYRTLSGQVTSSIGEPISGVDVELLLVGGASNELRLYQEFNVKTDENGMYEAPVVDGTYAISFRDERHSYPYSYNQELLNMHLPTSIQNVSVNGADVDAVDVVMERQYGISGTLTTMEGFRTPYMKVGLYEWDDTADRWSYLSSKDFYIDQDEHDYFIGGIQPGTYRVCLFPNDFIGAILAIERPIACHGGGGSPADGADVVMVDGADTTGVDIQFSGMGRVTGVVTDEQGNPLSDVHITYVPTFWFEESRPSTITADDGSFQFAVYPDLPYHITFNTPHWSVSDELKPYVPEAYDDIPFYTGGPSTYDFTDVVVGADETMTVTAALASLNILSTITGQITFENVESVGNSYVNLLKLDESTGEYGRAGGSASVTASGVYSVAGLGAGTYRLCYRVGINNYPRVNECYSDTVTGEAIDIEIGVGETITLPLTIDGSLRSTWVTQFTEATGQNVDWRNISFYKLNEATDEYEHIVTDPILDDGTFTITGIPAGSYLLCYGFDADGFEMDEYDQSYECYDSTGAGGATDIVIGESETFTLPITIDAPMLSTLTGQITVENDQPIRSGLAHLDRWNGAVEAYVSLISLDIPITESGAYTVTGLTAGRYQLCYNLRLEDGSETGQRTEGCHDDESGTVIDIVAGEGETISLATSVREEIPLAITLNRVRYTAAPPILIMIVTSALLISGAIVHRNKS